LFHGPTRHLFRGVALTVVVSGVGVWGSAARDAPALKRCQFRLARPTSLGPTWARLGVAVGGPGPEGMMSGSVHRFRGEPVSRGRLAAYE
jgi:hypothetical protein